MNNLNLKRILKKPSKPRLLLHFFIYGQNSDKFLGFLEKDKKFGIGSFDWFLISILDQLNGIQKSRFVRDFYRRLIYISQFVNFDNSGKIIEPQKFTVFNDGDGHRYIVPLDVCNQLEVILDKIFDCDQQQQEYDLYDQLNEITDKYERFEGGKLTFENYKIL